MTTRTTTWVLAFALLLTGQTVQADPQTFLELQAHLERNGDRAVLIVDRLFRFVGGRAVEERGALDVTCPSADDPQSMTVHAGDRLPVTLVEDPPHRGLIRRSRGGRVTLTLPPEGWVVACGDASHRLHGAFVAPEALANVLVFEGESAGFGSRLGLTRGRMPELPTQYRLRLAWSPIPPGPVLGLTAREAGVRQPR